MSRRGTRRNPIPPGGEDTRAERANAPAVAIAATAPIKAVLVEDFGRDKDLKNLLRNLLPKAFTGDGEDVPKLLEEWILSMEDYFSIAQYNSLAQGLMGRAKLDGPAKLWWKLHCQTLGRAKTSMSWGELKESLKERYLPLNYSTVKMNEFLSCVRKGRGIETYYEEFVKLSRHAPHMTEEQKLSRFVLGLEGQLADEINALRPTSLADALIRAKARLASFASGERKRTFTPSNQGTFRPHRVVYPIRVDDRPPLNTTPDRRTKTFVAPRPNPPAPKPPIQPTKVNAIPLTQTGRRIQCYDCQQWGHHRANCRNKVP